MKKLLKKIEVYIPLIAIISLIVLFVIARQLVLGYSLLTMMHDFMGATFIVFGGIKMLRWQGFVDAYTSYDIIAMRSRAYAYAYPLFEVGLGILFIMKLYPIATCVATIALTSLSTVSVIKELRKKNPFPCACLGVVFVLPMTWVTLFENLWVIGMSAMLLVMYL